MSHKRVAEWRTSTFQWFTQTTCLRTPAVSSNVLGQSTCTRAHIIWKCFANHNSCSNRRFGGIWLTINGLYGFHFSFSVFCAACQCLKHFLAFSTLVTLFTILWTIRRYIPEDRRTLHNLRCDNIDSYTAFRSLRGVGVTSVIESCITKHLSSAVRKADFVS
jgi:hypothetical protein